MQRENDAPKKRTEVAPVRKKLLQWIVRNETQRYQLRGLKAG
ncbi:MAG: hypothetical protein ACC645_27655 [Pirellulales bacterium]